MVSGTSVDDWATNLALAAAPGEVDLAADMAAAYVAGGRDRAQLFQDYGSTPASFDAGVVLTVFPAVLSAVVAVGTTFVQLLDVPEKITSLLTLWDAVHERLARRRETPAENAPSGTDHTYRTLVSLLETFQAELSKAGLDPDRSELIAYRAIRCLLDNPEGTREFLDAAASTTRR